jgi:hypothetical protein
LNVGEYLRLLREAALSIRVGGAQDLDRDGRAHQPVPCPPHDRVAALAEPIEQDEAVAGELFACSRDQACGRHGVI